jgi:hypothetical protein
LLLLLLTHTGVHLVTSNSSANKDYTQILVVMLCLRTIRWRLRDLRVLVIGLKALNTQNTPFLSSWCSGQSETVNT